MCFSSQLVSIITDETPIEQMKNRLIKDRSSTSSSSSSSSTSRPPHQPSHTRKPKLALLREVFGRGGFMFVIFVFEVEGVTIVKLKCPWCCVTALTNCIISLLLNLPSVFFSPGSVLCWLLPLHSSPPSVGGITYSALPDYDVWPMTRLRQRKRGKDGEEGLVRVCVCISVNEFSAYLRCLILGVERWRGRSMKTEDELRACVSVNNALSLCDFVPQDLKTKVRLMEFNFLCLWSWGKSTDIPIFRIKYKCVFLCPLISLTYCVWRVCPCVDTGLWMDLTRLIWIFLHWSWVSASAT